MWLRELVTKVLINRIIRTITRHFRRAYQPTRDNIGVNSQNANSLNSPTSKLNKIFEMAHGITWKIYLWPYSKRPSLKIETAGDHNYPINFSRSFSYRVSIKSVKWITRYMETCVSDLLYTEIYDGSIWPKNRTDGHNVHITCSFLLRTEPLIVACFCTNWSLFI
jgi:hypothetical protein